MRSFPVKNVSESTVASASPSQLTSWGVLHRDGIFYATSRSLGDELPFEVALHGVRSESEAQQAIALFSRPEPQAISLSN
jgi:hypothetical protein